MVSIINSKISTNSRMNPYHCQKTTNRRCSHTKTVIRILSLVAFMTVIAAAVSVSVRSDEKVLHKTLRGVDIGNVHGPRAHLKVYLYLKEYVDGNRIYIKSSSQMDMDAILSP